MSLTDTLGADIAICGSTHPGFLEAMGQAQRLSDRWKISLEHAHLTNAEVIVAHSQRMADEVQRFHGIDAAKIRLLYPPVDGERFSIVDDTERAERQDHRDAHCASVALGHRATSVTSSGVGGRSPIRSRVRASFSGGNLSAAIRPSASRIFAVYSS